MCSQIGSDRLGLIAESLPSRYSSLIVDALEELPDNFLITDPAISGHPIVFASKGFLKFSGYSKSDVVGRNARMFQGPSTDRRSVAQIREAIRHEKPLQITLLNYRKDGSPIWIVFHLTPVFNCNDGSVAHFVAVQVPISPTDTRVSSTNKAAGSVTGSCRREVCCDSVAELYRNSLFDPLVDSDERGRGVETKQPYKANDLEKHKAATAISNILSRLVHYSELTGKVVSEKRCSSVGIVPLSSSLNISLGRIKQSFVLTDPYLPDMPIVYASDAFLKLTGYSRLEVLGRNCRFLQGSDTNVEALCQIKDSIQSAQSCSVRILNYRKDGSSFWNLLHIAPVRNASGKIAFYVGVQIEESCKSIDQGLSPEMRQLGAVGAVKVAVRSLSVGVGPSKSS
uniref:Putative LOV domain-containing protein n=1 Tax=Gyrocarpus americanus TaxID=63807 RepID=A0A126WVG4_9MAGN|nr:putative LOV domain-containing protein [Gyrocarpus americanus]